MLLCSLYEVDGECGSLVWLSGGNRLIFDFSKDKREIYTLNKKMLGKGIERDNNPKIEAYSPEHKGED